MDLNQKKDSIVSMLQEKKMSDIKVYESSSSISDCIITCHGRSKKNISFVAEYISATMKNKLNYDILIDGIRTSDWVAIDIGDIMLHLFSEDFDNQELLDELIKKPL